jgi:CHAT domain-containing protein
MAMARQAFQRGDFAGAATHWQQAARMWLAAGQPHAGSIALTHLARAYEALGHTDQAETSLRTALPLAAPDGAQVALIVGHLSELSLASGKVTEAEHLLHEALARAQALADPGLTATLFHTQGNLFMLQQRWSEALAAYRDSAHIAPQGQYRGIAARALAHAARAAEYDGQLQTAEILLGEALTQLRHEEASHATAADLLLIGRAYQRLAHTRPDLTGQAAAVFQEVVTLAQTLQDPRALSYAWGYLGALYETAQRYDEALDLTRRAVWVAQQAGLAESLYLWQWQTGRLLRALGQEQPALAAYGRAVETVESLHTTLLRSQRGLHSTFRQAVGALYFEHADLLLHQATALQGQPGMAAEYGTFLLRARQTIEQFKTAELRDYFGDACVAAARPSVTALDQVSADAAIVYPILLVDRIELLVHLPAGLQRMSVPIPGRQVEQRAEFLRNALEARDPLRYLEHAQLLYRWLIAPLEADLARWPIHTLVFVPDGALRLIPLAVLHDGQRYLVEKYAVAITPSLTLTEPRPLPRQALRVLAAGMTEAAADFPPLPHVRAELHDIEDLYETTLLLDQAFNPARLDTALHQGRFGIVHIAAHGQFVADTAQSFLLTAQGKLSMGQLAQMVGRLRFGGTPLELLTLSACETARGDDRAALGLAGVAIQAGARSAIATLWQVADEATTVLMRTFYQHLRQPGMSRARALQQAQMTLLHHADYSDPFFWAPFLLINNWL